VRRANGTPSAGEAKPGELAATLLAMGELSARLDQRQRRTRRLVAGRFAEFAGAGTLRTLGIRTRAARA
jgi:hypothetical protein